MPFHLTEFSDLIIFEPQVWGDERGYFYESYNKKRFAEGGITADFIQDNQAFSTYGVLRGLHYQVGPYAQAKLVRVVQGEVLDIVVDLRPGAPTYRQSYSIRLSAENKKQLFVPRGFAHGYVVLSESAVFCYKVDNVYARDHEGGIIFNDPTLALNWQIPPDRLIVSTKDQQLPTLDAHRPIA